MTEVRSKFTEVDSVDTPDSGFGPVLAPSCGEPKNALFPVWFLSYRNHGRVAYSVVNGLTGKMSTDTPISVAKYLLFSLLLAIPLFFLLNVGLVLTPSAGLVATCVITGIGLITFLVNRSNIKKQETKELDKGYVSVYGKPGKTTHNGFFTGLIFPSIGLLIAIAILVFTPVSDIYYYAANLILIVATGFMLIQLIRQFNILATRPLPQFNKNRGEVDA
jgi:hypothetical protein